MDYIIGGGAKRPAGAPGPQSGSAGKGGVSSVGGLADPSAAGAGKAVIKDSNLDTFATDVLDASIEVPVLVDFWAPWCGPCKQLTPLLEKLVNAANGTLRLVKVNIDENPEIAKQLRIQSIPTVYAFKNGQPVDGFQGALPESQLKQFIERLVGPVGPSPVEDMLAVAKAALEAGDLSTAAQGFARVLQDAPGDPAAIAGLARCYLATADVKRAEETLALTPPEARTAPEIVSALAMLSLAKETGTVGDPAELETRLKANPKDHQARYDLAMALLGRGDRERAVDELLDIVRRERGWNEEAARKKLVTLFEAFGPEDPLTGSARRRLSSLLFS